jgi:triacylglycerol lipase
MGDVRFIGRVGALAFALGIGAGLAATPWVASAQPSESGLSSSSQDATPAGTGTVKGPSASAPSARSGSTETSTGSPTRRAISTRHAATRSAEPGVALGTGGARRGSTTPRDADTAATRPVTGSKASGADVTSHRRGPWSSAGSGKASGNDTGASAFASVPASGAGPTIKVDVGRVVADAVRRSASTTPSVASTATTTKAAVFSAVTRAATAAMSSSGSPPTPDTVVSDIASTVVNALSPFANDAPRTPVEAPTLWTLAAFARREFGQAVNRAPTVNPLAGHIENGLVTETPLLDGRSIDPGITGNIGAPTSALSGLTVNAQLDATAAPATFTGKPSIVSRAFTAAFRVLHAVGDFLGVELRIPVLRLISSDSPPWFSTLGLNVQHGEFEGMPVWTLQSRGSTSEETVVAIHGGAFIVQPTIFHWFYYAAIVRDTGATVIVPLYPLVPEGGTAGSVVPAMADLISAQIDQHGAENVSVYGDSAGGTIALAAVQELVRRGDPVPSHMVLSSPALDATLSNPAIQFVDDPLFAGLLPTLHTIAQQWAGDLDLTDPLVSPLYGSLAGLPPTAVYAGSRDIVAPDVLVLQDKALATPGADFTFILRNGEPHDWAAAPILPETQAVLPDIYQQLGIGSEAALDPT